MTTLSGLGTRLYRAVKTFATRHPTLTNSVMYGSILGTAEIMQQTIAGYERYNWTRVRNVMIIGSCAYGPIGFHWYRWLDRTLPGTAKLTVAKKVLSDQFVSAPIFTAIFFAGTSILEGKKDIFADLKDKFARTYAVSCCFWPVAQTINFFFVPPHFRVLYVASLSLVWSNFLCFMKRVSPPHTTDAMQVKAATQG